MKTIYIIIGFICLFTAHGSPVPEKEGASDDKEPEEVIPLAYTVPNSTWNYSTIEEILAEIATNKAEKTDETEHRIQKRALGCVSTAVAYGSSTGTAFADFTSAIDFTSTSQWPCGVDIVQIKLRVGGLIDAIQLRYRTVDGVYIQGPWRGGAGGALYTITLETGERITGVSGVVCTGVTIGTYISQLTFFSEKSDGQRRVYGPYAGSSYGNYRGPCRMFSVNAKINSIFGRVRDHIYESYRYNDLTAITAIGFFYEDESRSPQHAYNFHA